MKSIDKKSLIRFAEYSQKIGDMRGHDWALRMIEDVPPLVIDTSALYELVMRHALDTLKTQYREPHLFPKSAVGYAAMKNALDHAAVFHSKAPMYRLEIGYTLEMHKATQPPALTIVML